ncbi:MAG TPA: AgmX/PglI C-terminal domain-containing protein, partial [Anaeromyxobacteraceae bacterium]|nr:AgmX/PglI C-terminal domain-containing protein [Anaeromyxobacteraceae bacterium]
REREALARAQNEHTDYDRLAAQGNAARDRGTQLEWRKQAVGARQRQLAAEETRLVAKGERLDAMERQQRAREDQLDAWQRRLDTRSERLQLVERRAAEQGKPAEAAPAPAAGGVAAGAGGSKDKAVFVMVVKSPTAIMKEQPPKPAGTAEVPAPLHPGVAVEKAVAAATVVYFPTPSAQLSELDREGLENIARLAAREGCEVLVWARAKDPGLMSEASRRSTEIKNLLLKAAPVADKQIVTRITTRPGAQGVDVVVSALRAQPAAAPVPVKADAPAGAPAPALARPPGQELGTGETARRQLREAVQAHQNDIERCIGTELARRRIQSADVLLKLVVGGDGVVRRAEISEGPLAVEEVRSCLGAVAKTWRFPQTGSEYVVDVPITVVAPGKKP